MDWYHMEGDIDVPYPLVHELVHLIEHGHTDRLGVWWHALCLSMKNMHSGSMRTGRIWIYRSHIFLPGLTGPPWHDAGPTGARPNAVNLRKSWLPTPSPRRKPGSRKARKDWILR